MYELFSVRSICLFYLPSQRPDSSAYSYMCRSVYQASCVCPTIILSCSQHPYLSKRDLVSFTIPHPSSAARDHSDQERLPHHTQQRRYPDWFYYPVCHCYHWGTHQDLRNTLRSEACSQEVVPLPASCSTVEIVCIMKVDWNEGKRSAVVHVNRWGVVLL